jgi:SAM-dependent methyltransferase
MSSDEIFSRAARRVRRHHVARAAPGDRWLLDRMWGELAARAMDALPSPQSVLLVGEDFGALAGAPLLSSPTLFRTDPGWRAGWPNPALACDEDRIDTHGIRFDLILACGTLDSLHDVPGALILMRRLLNPGGRFFGAMLGAGSLITLRQIVYGGEGAQVARLHPQIDVRAGGDLLARAGFAEPVGDMEVVPARYGGWQRYIDDLRANGVGNCLTQRHPLPRATLARWIDHFNALKDEDGRVTEEFCPVYLSGTSPFSSQA